MMAALGTATATDAAVYQQYRQVMAAYQVMVVPVHKQEHLQQEMRVVIHQQQQEQ
jgi:hypothetical protein